MAAEQPRDADSATGRSAYANLAFISRWVGAALPWLPAAALLAYSLASVPVLLRGGADAAAWRDWAIIPAALLAGGLGWRGVERSRATDGRGAQSLPPLVVAQLAVMGVLLYRPSLGNVGAAIVGIMLAAAAAFCLWLCLLALDDGDGIGMDSNWSGFGGALGGWKLTPAASLAVLALVLAGAAVTASHFAGGDGGAPGGHMVAAGAATTAK